MDSKKYKGRRAAAHCLLIALCGFSLLLILGGCSDPKAQQIVDAAIKAHGGRAYESFVLEFDFRSRHYTAARNGGIFSYSREFTNPSGRIRDVLSNSGFTRYVNGKAVKLPAEQSAAFTRSVNSVIYFALLPFGLDDDAVNKEWIEDTTIEGEPYDVVRVTFDPTGGGEDHQDVFRYWFHQQHHTMDYLAYAYETEGGGLRFRKAVNPRKIGGILLQDYINYKPQDESVALEKLQSMFTSGRLEKLSEINLENVTVRPYEESDHTIVN